MRDLRLVAEQSVQMQASLIQSLKLLDARSDELKTSVRELSEAVRSLNQRVEAAETALARTQAEITALSRSPIPSPALAPPRPVPSPAESYTVALALFNSGEYGQAVLDFRDLAARYPGHMLAPHAQFWIARPTTSIEIARTRSPNTMRSCVAGRAVPACRTRSCVSGNARLGSAPPRRLAPRGNVSFASIPAARPRRVRARSSAARLDRHRIVSGSFAAQAPPIYFPDTMERSLRPGEDGYPALLSAIASAPPLHVRGALTADDALAIAIVGSRRATPYGLAVAEELAADLAARGVTIVSGLARGIDTAAHRGALHAGGRTIAVLGSGIDVIYPADNHLLAREIEARGALVSQFPPGTAPRPWNFPARNRILAGLTLGVVVVEAGERSGALITAGFAADLGREVFAVPGKITDEMSQGPLRLLQDGAKLVRDWSDVVQELPEHWRRALRAPSTSFRAPPQPSDRTAEGRVLALLAADEPRQIDELIGGEIADASQVSAALVALEIGGWVRQLPGQRWVAARRPRAEGPEATGAH